MQEYYQIFGYLDNDESTYNQVCLLVGFLFFFSFFSFQEANPVSLWASLQGIRRSVLCLYSPAHSSLSWKLSLCWLYETTATEPALLGCEQRMFSTCISGAKEMLVFL